MKYKLTVRKLEEQETATEKCYQAETDEETYASHLNVLVEDIENNELVNNASESDNVITIESNLSARELKDNLEELFKREFCFVRFVNLEQIT